MIKKILFLIIPCSILLSCNSDANKYDASGTFEATEIIVSAEATGKLLKFDVMEGMSLKQQTYIGFIDTAQIYAQKEQIIYSIDATKARIPDIDIQTASLYKQLNNALIDQKRIANLYNQNAATQQQLDNINTQVSTLQKQIDAQKNTLSQATNSTNADAKRLQAQLQQINDMLKKSYIYNPINGIVLAKYRQQFEFVTQGVQLYKIANLSEIYLRAFVTGDQLKNVLIGQNVKVRADDGNKAFKTFDGVITWISDNAEFTPKNIQTKNQRADLVYAVKILVKNDEGFLKIGQYGDVSFK